MLVKALKLQGANSSLDFADAGSIQTWAKPYVAAAQEAGVMNSRGDNRLAPAASATRAEAVTVILNMLDTLAELKEQEQN